MISAKNNEPELLSLKKKLIKWDVNNTCQKHVIEKASQKCSISFHNSTRRKDLLE